MDLDCLSREKNDLLAELKKKGVLNETANDFAHRVFYLWRSRR